MYKWISKHPVCVFIKGTRADPKCHLSKDVLNILDHYSILDFHAVDILKHAAYSDAIKEYSNWRSFPQVFLKSKFYGGALTFRRLHEDGSLEDYLIKERVIRINP